MITAVVAERTKEGLERRLAGLASSKLPLPLMAEVRLDFLREAPIDILTNSPVPLLLTCRRARDGGAWEGDEIARRELLMAAAHVAAWIDIEDDVLPEVDPPFGPLVLASIHDLHGIPEDLEARVAAARSHGANMVKVAVRIENLAPLPRLAALSATGPTLAFGLGAAGLSSRLLFRQMQSAWIYARAGEADAPGLPPLEALAHHGPALANPEVRLGVLGDQAEESVGPHVWPDALRACGKSGLYLPVTTANLDGLREALGTLGFHGLSVTTPFKQRLLSLADEVGPTAASVGAANTVLQRDDGTLFVENTDVEGIEVPVRHLLGPGPAEGSALVLGAGGAGRAAAWALKKLGLRVHAVSRGTSRVEEMVEQLGLEAGWPEEKARVIVNATPAGGPRAPGIQPLPKEQFIGPGQVIVEMNYRRGDTPLLADARARECDIVSGWQVYLAQATGQARLFGLDEDTCREELARGIGKVPCWDDELSR